ncbi:MAG: hypothetical protein U9Q78_01965 [Chloroflexota bacterium]|nr:hypothetical protein [Chloroflexota bacterium]
MPPGHVVWHGTLDTGHKPTVGRRAEEEPTVTTVLPLITDNDVAERARGCPAGKHGVTWARERSIRRMVRLVPVLPVPDHLSCLRRQDPRRCGQPFDRHGRAVHSRAL